MANRYWVGGTGNWTDTAHWSDTSGGTGGFSVPTTSDDVYLDSNSGSGTITDTTTITTAAFNCTGYAGTLNIAGCTFLGNVTLNSSMTFNCTGAASFRTISGSTISVTSAGKTFGGTAAFTIQSGSNGTINLQDDFTCVGTLSISSNTINTNNNNITCNAFFSNSNTTRTFNQGSGTLTITGTGNVFFFNQGTYTYNAGTGTVLLSNTTTSSRNIGVGATSPVALTFNKIIIGGTTGTSNTSFVGSVGHTIGELASTKTVAHTITFPSSVTTTVGTWSVNGSSGNLVSIRAFLFLTQATLAKSGGGTVTADYLDIRDSAATPSSTWTATNSTDSGNNTGWTFASGAAATNSLLFGSNF